jgi:hypothetical protein
MKTIVHTCDICKQSKSEDDLAHIGVTTRGITISSNRYHPAIEFDICKDCLEIKGFIVESPAEMDATEVEKRNTKTLEGKILDILDDLGVAFHE